MTSLLRLLAALLLFLVPASAQVPAFVPGQTLTAAELNAAVAALAAADAANAAAAAAAQATANAALPSATAGTGSVTATGGTTARTLAARAADVFNIADYGAVCDGATNDNTAINATFAAAAASAAYTNNNSVLIVGPQGAPARGCLMNSINATIFQRGTGANLRPRVTVRDMTLLCTGAGNICFDALGSDLIKLQNVSIRGNTAPNTPEICIQIGMINGTSAAWHSFDHVNCANEFAFTAMYNFGSEAVTWIDSMFGNNHTANGPIQTLGAVTAGTTYTNGTYTNVPLTGGSGTGALASIVVAGTVVSTVTVTYQGRDYVAGDTLSADAASIGGTGSGFTIPVATAFPYAVVLDGQNYWRAASAFQTETLAVNTWQSLTLNTFYNTSIRNGLWVAWTGGLRMVNSYILNSPGPSCMTIFDNGVTKAGIPGPNWGLDLEFNCEGTDVSMIQMSGSKATPVLQGFRYGGYHLATGSAIKADSNITAATIKNADINIKFAQNAGVSMFANAKLWTVSGKIAVPDGTYWNAPAAFKGQLVVGSLATPPAIGPVDIMGSAAQAVSCARQLSASYIGPLCQVTRASDSATQDIYPTSIGDLDRNAFTAFCRATTCAVSVMYDQSGNTNDFTQGTGASQPVLTLALAALGNRPALLFGDQSAFAMTATAAASINDLWAAGGSLAIVTNQTGAANAADRALYKSSGATPGVGWEYRCGFVGTSRIFTEGATTTNGLWTTSALQAVPHIEDIQYSSASLANNALVASDGTALTVTTTAVPVGTVTTDASRDLLLGNSAATGGTRGFPGYIAEVVLWKATPTAAQLEAIRRNQAAYYGVAGVN